MFFLKLFLFFFLSYSSSQNFFLLSVKIPTDAVKLKELNPDVDIPNSFESFEFSFENLIVSTSSIKESDIAELEEEDEEAQLKELYLLKEPKPVNLGGDGLLTIIRKDNGEVITVRYRNEDGSYNEDALERINRIARCSLTGEVKKIPIKLIELIDRISDRFGKRAVILLSGYRSKPLNDITPGAAKKSMHLIGWAMDIRIDGVSSRRVKDFARSLKLGGVGYYPRYGFVHVDIGKVRYWEKYQYRKKIRYAKNHSKSIRLHRIAFKNTLKK
ncbi:MAG: YcbK family protein [Elusimicrobiales bacterium]